MITIIVFGSAVHVKTIFKDLVEFYFIFAPYQVPKGASQTLDP